MVVSDRWLSMWLELFVWQLPQRTCEIKDARTDHPPTVSVCLFDGMNVTLTNLIIFTSVHITILIMAANVPAVVVPPPPARNPVDQALAWIGFGTEGNHNSIRDEGGLEAFDDFIGLNKRDIRDMDPGLFKTTTAQGCINFCMRHVKYTLFIMNWAQYESRCSCTGSLPGIVYAK